MKLKLVVVGKLKDNAYQMLSDDYFQRIRHYTPIELIELKDEKITSAASPDLIIQNEQRRIEKQVVPTQTMLLDRRGREYSSEELAFFFRNIQNQGQSTLFLVIGGALGFSQEFAMSCQYCWSLSRLTLPHQLARVVVLEQVYRAFTILRGEQYHK